MNPPESNNTNPQVFIPQKNLPNSVAVLVLGICSIFPGCVCFGFGGIICGIVALVLAKKDLLLYNANRNEYSLASYNNLNAGRICAIIGLIFGIIQFLFCAFYLIIAGAALSMMMPWNNL